MDKNHNHDAVNDNHACCTAEAAIYKANGHISVAQRIPVTEDAQSVRAFRDEVALHVIQEAERMFPETIQFHFNAPIQHIDLNRQLVTHASPADQIPAQVH